MHTSCGSMEVGVEWWDHSPVLAMLIGLSAPNGIPPGPSEKGRNGGNSLPPRATHGCMLISLTVIRFSVSTVSILRMRSARTARSRSERSATK
jgi:hypothetical protein